MSTVIDLLTDLLTGPDLHGAACVEHRDVFDATANRGAHRTYGRAIKVCAGCPALAACRAWVTSLPHDEAPRGGIEGLPETFSHHDLRHYFASLLIACGADIKDGSGPAPACVGEDHVGHLRAPVAGH